MVSTTNVISAWKLNESSGTTATDSHGSNDGTIGGTGVTVNQTSLATNLGTCYRFIDNDNGHVNCGNDNSLNPSQITICGWFKQISSTGNDIILAMFGTGSPYYVQINNSPKKLLVGFNTSGGTNQLISTTTISLNTTYFFMATWDSTNGGKLYLNGSTTPEDSDNTYSGALVSSNENLCIGALRTSDSLLELNGYISDVTMFSDVQPAQTSEDLYNSGDGLVYPFSSGVTVNPSPVALSTSNLSPSYVIDITSGPVSLMATPVNPSLSLPVIFNADTIPLTVSIINPIAGGPNIDITGTIGTYAIANRWPVEEGLIAGTTKQTRNPNLVATEETSF